MTKSRLEAFSDGVVAILITIMVLELHAPHDSRLESLRPLTPVLASYVLSFAYLGIYWNNHHHMLQSARHVSGAVLWANQHLLFWLSLIPFATSWMGQNQFASMPVLVYGLVLLGAAVAYYVLARTLVKANGLDSTVARALGADFKGKASVVLYCVAIAFATFAPFVSCAVYIGVALMWLVPDRRFERSLVQEAPSDSQ